MGVQQVERSGWPVFFDTFTKSLPGKRAEVEVASLDLGDQIQAEWAPVIGISYDGKDDLIELALEGIDHLILEPREVFVDFDVGGLIALEVVDAAGVRQIIKFKDAVALPAPDGRPAASQAR